jgi:hypothetical protein
MRGSPLVGVVLCNARVRVGGEITYIITSKERGRDSVSDGTMGEGGEEQDVRTEQKTVHHRYNMAAVSTAATPTEQVDKQKKTRCALIVF